MAAYKDLTVRLLSVLEIQAELEWMKPEAIQEALGIMKKSSGFDAVLADKRFGELKSLLAGGLMVFIPEMLRLSTRQIKH